MSLQQPPIRDLVPIPAVWERLEVVEHRLVEVTEAEDAFLTKIARHLLAAGGKRFRPLLAQVAAELGTVSDDRPVDAGVAVELVHVGSLYHDDVIDESDARRGVVSANANWDNTVAILAGDFVLARASEVAARRLGTEAVALLARTYARLVEGQTLELQLTDNLTHGPDDYYRVIANKTASLIQTAARLGAMAADADDKSVEAVSTWAWEVGMAFQIIDDVLDLVASSEFLGKPAGSDIGEGTYTLAVLNALEGDAATELRSLLEPERPYSPATVDRVIGIVRHGGHVDAAVQVAEEHLARSEAALAAIDNRPVTDVLRTLAAYLVGQIDSARS